MTKREVLATRYADMVDMISCFAIYHGAKPKNKRKLTQEEIWELR